MENKCLSKTILKLLIFHICKIMFIQRCGSGTAGVGNYTVYRSSCRRDGLFQITDSDMKLKNGIIVSSSQKDLSHCARQCVKTIGCLSLNFSPSILQNSNCEILDNSKEDNGSVMEATSGWKHYEPVVSVSRFSLFISAKNYLECRSNFKLTMFLNTYIVVLMSTVYGQGKIDVFAKMQSFSKCFNAIKRINWYHDREIVEK